MKVFYLCRTGHHTSILAAALHIGLVCPGDKWKANSLPGYDDINSKTLGKPYYVGEDDFGRKIYTFGTGKESIIITRAANDLISLMGVTPGSWKIVDTSPFISRWTYWGLQVKRLGIKRLSDLFFFLGAKRELIRLSKSEEIIQMKNYN